jgi:hypothetical protein
VAPDDLHTYWHSSDVHGRHQLGRHHPMSTVKGFSHGIEMTGMARRFGDYVQDKFSHRAKPPVAEAFEGPSKRLRTERGGGKNAVCPIILPLILAEDTFISTGWAPERLASFWEPMGPN